MTKDDSPRLNPRQAFDLLCNDGANAAKTTVLRVSIQRASAFFGSPLGDNDEIIREPADSFLEDFCHHSVVAEGHFWEQDHIGPPCDP